MLKIGDPAPDFILPNQKGEPISLESILKSKTAVVYFYPKDETAGCTAEACSFRDNYEDFVALGAEVIGISRDRTEKHASFASNHRLPFILLTDVDGAIAKMYKVPKTFGFISGRVTYIINQQGRVIFAFNSQFQALLHIKKALEILKSENQ